MSVYIVVTLAIYSGCNNTYLLPVLSSAEYRNEGSRGAR